MLYNIIADYGNGEGTVWESYLTYEEAIKELKKLRGLPEDYEMSKREAEDEDYIYYIIYGDPKKIEKLLFSSDY